MCDVEVYPNATPLVYLFEANRRSPMTPLLPEQAQGKGFTIPHGTGDRQFALRAFTGR